MPGSRGREVTSKRKFCFTCFYINLNSPREGGGTDPHPPSRSEHAQTAKDYQIINIFIMFIYHRHLTLYIFLIIKNTYLHKILNDILGTGYIFFMMRKISTQCYVWCLWYIQGIWATKESILMVVEKIIGAYVFNNQTIRSF